MESINFNTKEQLLDKVISQLQNPVRFEMNSTMVDAHRVSATSKRLDSLILDLLS